MQASVYQLSGNLLQQTGTECIQLLQKILEQERVQSIFGTLAILSPTQT